MSAGEQLEHVPHGRERHTAPTGNEQARRLELRAGDSACWQCRCPAVTQAAQGDRPLLGGDEDAALEVLEPSSLALPSAGKVVINSPEPVS